MKLTNKDRWNYIKSFNDGGFIGSYLNEIKKVLSEQQPVSTPEEEILFNQPQTQPDIQRTIIRNPIEVKDRGIDLQSFTPNITQVRDSFNPNTLSAIIPKIQHNLNSESIVESEKITDLENIQKQDSIAAELAKRTSNEYLPIEDYIPPPPKPTVPSINEVGNLQEYLINQGIDVGKSGADGKLGTNTIKGLQRFLMKEGYDIGQNEGYADDGILGTRTKNALEDYRNKNNIKEENTYQSPYENSIIPKLPKGYIGACEEEQCSEFVQNEISRNTGIPLSKIQERTGLTGDAWRITDNIRKRGGKLLYDDETGLSNLESISKGSLVSMFTGGGSDYQQQADDYSGGKNTPTHIGVVDSNIQEDSKGKFFYVLHNVHSGTKGNYKGNVFRNKVYLDNMKVSDFNFSVKQISKPSLGDVSEIEVNPNIKIQPLENAPNNKVANNMIKTINSKDNQKKIMFDLGLTEQEYYDVAQAALGLVGQESKFGKVDAVPLVPGRLELLGKEALAYAGRGALDVMGKDSGETSLGFGRIKYNTNFKDIERRLKSGYGISKGSLSAGVDDGTNSIIATMFALGRRYNDLKRDDSLDKDELMYLAIQRFNRYNLDRPYGDENRSSKEYAKDRDIDYVNKVLNFANSFEVTDGEKKYNTKVKDLNRDVRIIEKQLLSSQR